MPTDSAPHSDKTTGEPGTITVEVFVTDTVPTIGADLLVTVRGGSLVTGNAAVKKAREVRALIQALTEVGLQEEDVHIEGIRASVNSGLIAKSSHVEFTLRIGCDRLEELSKVVGAVTSQKQADLLSIDWRYPENQAVAINLLRRAVLQAREKAELIAGLLGSHILGIHAVVETYPDLNKDPAHPSDYDYEFSGVRRSAAPTPDLGLVMSNTRSFGLNLQASFRVGSLP